MVSERVEEMMGEAGALYRAGKVGEAEGVHRRIVEKGKEGVRAEALFWVAKCSFAFLGGKALLFQFQTLPA
jgi:hypothetical protein